jgi:hypothetical protein
MERSLRNALRAIALSLAIGLSATAASRAAALPPVAITLSAEVPSIREMGSVTQLALSLNVVVFTEFD